MKFETPATNNPSDAGSGTDAADDTVLAAVAAGAANAAPAPPLPMLMP